MDASGPLFSTLLVLVVSADLMMVLSHLRLLPWRVSCAFAFVGSLSSGVAVAVTGGWATAGVFAASTALAAFYWWKHRNDDDDDETKRRRRVAARMKSRLPKLKAFARPMPVSS